MPFSGPVPAGLRAKHFPHGSKSTPIACGASSPSRPAVLPVHSEQSLDLMEILQGRRLDRALLFVGLTAKNTAAVAGSLVGDYSMLLPWSDLSLVLAI